VFGSLVRRSCLGVGSLFSAPPGTNRSHLAPLCTRGTQRPVGKETQVRLYKRKRENNKQVEQQRCLSKCVGLLEIITLSSLRRTVAPGKPDSYHLHLGYILWHFPLLVGAPISILVFLSRLLSTTAATCLSLYNGFVDCLLARFFLPVNLFGLSTFFLRHQYHYNGKPTYVNDTPENLVLRQLC